MPQYFAVYRIFYHLTSPLNIKIVNLIRFIGNKHEPECNYEHRNVVLIDKDYAEFGYFICVFRAVDDKAIDLVPCTKLFRYNRRGNCFSVNQIISGYSEELFERLKFSKNLMNAYCTEILRE